MDVFGKALLEYQLGKYTEDIITYSSLEEEDSMPLPYLFRSYDTMPSLEKKALQLCYGSVLDIGCGSGSHALYLQQQGLDVVGLDASPGAIEVCNLRGLHKTVLSEFLAYQEATFDTLLLLMNGIGMAGTLKKLPEFLNHAKSLLKEEGQLLVDSSDIIYMFESDSDGGYWVPGDVDYYGEVQFRMAYKGEKGPVFDWIYVDFETLADAAKKVNLDCELIVAGEHYDYLAKLYVK